MMHIKYAHHTITTPKEALGRVWTAAYRVHFETMTYTTMTYLYEIMRTYSYTFVPGIVATTISALHS